jgi:putative peptide zinc metalloprotease protein
MNLAEALTAALPELPARSPRQQHRYLLDPSLIVREEVNADGVTEFMVLNPATHNVFRLAREHWLLAQYFDGQRTVQQVVEDFTAETGLGIDEEMVRNFAHDVDSFGFWYKTRQEKNICLCEKLAEQRRKRAHKKSRAGDLASIEFSAWDPDKFLTRVHQRIGFVYSGWFTALTLALFAFMSWVFIERWGEIGRDTLQYYTFTEKGLVDLAEFWLLFLGLGFFHESAHGLTCKHYGGGVHSMGFQLIYLTPAFFIDSSESLVYATRWQRIAVIIAGIWVELIFCGIATVVWWGTPPGTSVHEFAYKIMLITGVAVVIVNLNPLIRLDGYYIFSELVGLAEVKERSTQFVSSWVQKNIFRLPVEVEFVPVRRRPMFVAYALLSGAYSYGLLYAVCRFAYNVFRSFSPEWGFVPALGLALLIFRSRIRKLVNFMKIVYVDKKERARRWLRGPRLAIVSVLAAVVLLAPIWPDTVSGRFLLEPAARAVVRAAVPGTVVAILADEGDTVAAGAPLARLRNLKLESAAARSRAELYAATARATQAQLRQADFGRAEAERRSLATISSTVDQEVSHLELASPLAGVVVTPRVRDVLGSYVTEGTVIAEIADIHRLRARIYLPEHALRQVRTGAPVTLHFDSRFAGTTAQLESVAVAPSEVPAGLMPTEAYKGMHPARYYAASAWLDNSNGSLRDGLSGSAKVFDSRRSLAAFAWRTVFDFAAGKLW